MNKFFKNIITIFVALTFLFSSIGVRFESPCCENEMREVERVNESSCCSTEIVEEPKDSCCETESKSDHICQNDCEGACFTSYTYFKLDIDQITHVVKSFEKENTFIAAIYDDITEQTEITFEKNIFNKAPPNLWGKDLILSLHKAKIPIPLSL